MYIRDHIKIYLCVLQPSRIPRIGYESAEDTSAFGPLPLPAYECKFKNASFSFSDVYLNVHEGAKYHIMLKVEFANVISALYLRFLSASIIYNKYLLTDKI